MNLWSDGGTNHGAHDGVARGISNMLVKTEYGQVEPYATKDGSQIRELMHPHQYGLDQIRLSLAEATVPPGKSTLLHRHLNADEIYHVTSGSGVMVLGRERFKVLTGDSILIPRGTPHRIENTEIVPLAIICCCSPPYAHEDTELLGDQS